MRILHTSDWHLGRSFHREGLLAAQADFVDHLLEVVESERVDLVVVSGDIYDRALPQVDAVRLADEAFARLAASPARVVLTSGNHDSAQRLGFGSRLMDAAGIHVRTDAGSLDRPILLEDRHGPVAVYGLPYLDPQLLREPWQLPARSHEAALSEAMRRVRADLDRRPAVTRSVVLAHAFVAGCAPSDSERDISVGGVSMVSASVFDGVDYTALGHLHGPHVLSDGGPLQRIAARLLLLRGRPAEGLVAGRPRRRRLRRRRVRRRAGAAAAGRAPRRSRDAADRSRPRPPRARLGRRRRSPTACGRCGPWSGCASDSRTP